jgi:hypothetical protein
MGSAVKEQILVQDGSRYWRWPTAKNTTSMRTITIGTMRVRSSKIWDDHSLTRTRMGSLRALYPPLSV